MTTRIHSELRKLALAYYRGWIPREKYLSIRSKYLGAISRDEIPEPIDSKQIAPPPRETPYKVLKKRKKRLWLAGSVVAVIVVAIALALFLTDTEQPVRPVQPSPTVQQSAVQPSVVEQPSASDPAEETMASMPPPPKPVSLEERFTTYLEDQFISQRTWDQDSLDSLKLKWLALNQEQQENVRESGVFRDFTNSLVERIVGERKLNNIVPSDYELALMTTAKNFGVINQIPEP